MSDANSGSKEPRWYAVHTYSDYENKVKVSLDNIRKNRHIEDEILEVVVPVQDVMEVKKGVKRQVKKKLYPGYILVHMVMNDENWYIVRNTRGVAGFVGPEGKPVPLSDDEVTAHSTATDIEITTDLVEGETVYVISGVWKDTVGVIQTVNHNKQTVTINVELFGRQTPVEISFTEVERQD